MALVGNNDSKVSEHLKIWIQQGSDTVVAVMGEGTAKEMAANWDSPFEGEDVGSKFEVASALTQMKTGATSTTTLNTRQIWNGNRPTSLSLVLSFYALSDPKAEVMDALMMLDQFISPQLENVMPFSLNAEAVLTSGGGDSALNVGRIPQLVSVRVGNKIIYPECVIENISTPLDGPVDKNGHLIRADVQVSVSTVQVANRDMISTFYP